MTSPKLLKPYRKRITVTEREKGSLIVRRIQVFPSEGIPFEVKIGGESFETIVVDMGCEHHEHYCIHLQKMREMPKGTIAPLTRVDTGEYKLSLG